MPEWLDDLLEGATKYEPLIKTGIAAASTYLSYEDQKKKNKLQQQAYNDYMAQVGQAGDEARAAIDINYTPMTVSGVPTTKADVTDFTAVAARGGLMNLPNRQRKRYFAGTGEEDVMEIEEESITPFGLQQETGIDLTGEQVKYETGNSRQDAWGVWNSGAINQEIYEFDFEIFFDSGDWMDRLRGQAPATGNMQMASSGLGINPKILAEWEADGGASGPYKTPEEYYEAYYGDMEMVATGGIIGLRHGGRPGYAEDGFVTADVEEVVSEVPQSQKNLIEGNQMAEDAMNKIMYKFMEKFPGIDSSEMSIEDMIAMLQAEGVWGTEGAGIMDISAGMDMITPESVSRDTQRFARGDTQWGDIPMAQGGRPGYRFGDEVIADQEAIVKTPNEEVVINDMEEIQGQTAGGGARGWKAQMVAEEWAWDRYGMEFYDLSQVKQIDLYSEALDFIDSGGE